MTPRQSGVRTGNRVTADRWTRILRSLGHRVHSSASYHGERCDLLIALHARKSGTAIERFRASHVDAPLIVALTGTDLYRDIKSSEVAQRSLDLATQLILLQPHGKDEIPQSLQHKIHVIYQSAEKPKKKAKPKRNVFEVCVLGNLRPVKDPFRTAIAARRLPMSSRIRIVHVGAATSAQMEQRALEEQQRNPRYHWLGERSHGLARRILARCRLMVLSSKSEGGANVVSEACVASVPIVASRIPGSVGLLGDDYPGYFAVGDTAELRTLLERAERDVKFLAQLKSHCTRLAPLFKPRRERDAWRKLLRQVF